MNERNVQIIEKDGRPEYAVLPIDDYHCMVATLEDARDRGTSMRRSAASRRGRADRVSRRMMQGITPVMLCIMRTTISLEDRLATQVRREAAAQGVSVSAFIARTLDDALKRRAPAEPPKPFRLIAAGGNGTRPSIDLDRPRAIEAAEDEMHFGRRGA